MKIIVMSCDKYSDTFEPFHNCMEKYWKDHPEIIYSTESISNPYYKTINKNYDVTKWSVRLRETLQEIRDKYVIVMCDDIFLREYADSEEIAQLTKYFDDSVASINLENHYDDKDTQIDSKIGKRADDSKYRLSAMCSIGDRKKLIDILDRDGNPGEFEKEFSPKNYTYLIVNKSPLNGGHKRVGDSGGICRGKGCLETKEFFEKEGIKVDYSKKGFYENIKKEKPKKCLDLIEGLNLLDNYE